MIRQVYEVTYMERFGHANTYKEAIAMENEFKTSYGDGGWGMLRDNNGNKINFNKRTCL